MAARKTAVPGEVEVKTETPQASTAPTAEEITPDIKGDDQSTSSLGTPVEPIDTTQITQILENQCRIENKIDQLLKAGGIQAVKKKRWVQGKHGLEHKEI